MEASLSRRLASLGLLAIAGAAAWGLWLAKGTALATDPLPLRGASFRLAAWSLAALVGVAYAVSWRVDARRAVGMALMWVPVTRTALAIANDAAILTTGGQVLPAYSHQQLSDFYIFSIMRNLGYLGAGFLLWSGWRPGDALDRIAQRLRSTGAPLVHAGEVKDMRLGLALFPLLLGAAYLFNVLATSNTPQLVNSDESSIWDNMTPWHAIMISAAAAVGEEAWYRVFLMTSLAAVLARFRLPGHLPWAGAVALQGVFFGFAHASYGNWLHVIEASLFGLLAGVAALRFGIWVPIVLHFLIDIYAIGGHADNVVWFWLLVLALIGMALNAIVLAARALPRRPWLKTG